MVLLNLVCFGPRQKTMHEYVLSARDSGRLADSGRFRLKECYDRPVRAPFEEFGDIGSRAVVLDACSTASDDWLYDGGSLRAECRSLKDKPLLGGSGNSQPNEGHGKKILGAPSG
jgi:hypothetical protein